MSERMTITEALAEVRTIEKRLAKKREFIQNYLFRQERFKDPLARNGGSVEALGRENQAIGDLQKRLIAIRIAIAAANAAKRVSLGGEDRSISEWLIWRREIAPRHQEFLAALRGQLKKMRSDAQAKGIAVTAAVAAVAGSERNESDVVVNIDEGALAEEIEGLEEILGALDGQLSLVNATTFVEF